MGREDPLTGLSEFAESAEGYQVTAWLQVSHRFDYLVGWFARFCTARIASEAPEDVVSTFLTIHIPRIHAKWLSGHRKPFRAYFWRSYRRFASERCQQHCAERDRAGLTPIEEQQALEHFDAVPDHEVEVILKQRLGLLGECLSALDPKYSRVLHLHFSDFTTEDIAIRTGQPAATVRTWLSRGRQKLHELVYMRLLRFTAAHVRNWPAVCRLLHLGRLAPAGSAHRRVWEGLPKLSQALIAERANKAIIDLSSQVGIIESLNCLLTNVDLFDSTAIDSLGADDPEIRLIAAATPLASSRFAIPINRVLLEQILKPHVVEDAWVRRGLRTWTSLQ